MILTIRDLRKKKKISLDEISSVIGISRQQLSNYETGKATPPLDTAIKIADYLDLEISNIVLNEDGFSYNVKDSDEKSNSPIRSYPKAQQLGYDSSEGNGTLIITPAAQAGYESGRNEDPEFINSLSRYILPPPLINSQRGFTIEGDSMFDKFKPGDIVPCSLVESIADIAGGEIYVIVTKKKGTFIKEVHTFKDKLKLVSTNPAKRDGKKKYGDIWVDKSEVREIWKAKGSVSNNLANREEIHEIEIDSLNNEILLLKDQVDQLKQTVRILTKQLDKS